MFMSDIRTAYAKCPCCNRFVLENGEYYRPSYIFAEDPANSPQIVNMNLQILDLVNFDRENPGHFPHITCSSCAYKQVMAGGSSEFFRDENGVRRKLMKPRVVECKGA